MAEQKVEERLGEAIRYFRLKRGISQEKLAFESRLHFTYISSVERGKRNISIKNIIKICNALEITAAVLLKQAAL